MHRRIGGAYAAITVLCKPRTREEGYDYRHVPAYDPGWKVGNRHVQLLLHELVGHWLNGLDEKGKKIESDSALSYNWYKSGKIKFYQRHFHAGIADISNIAGEKIRPWMDMTSELDVKDPWFRQKNNKALAQHKYEMVNEIIRNAK